MRPEILTVRIPGASGGGRMLLQHHKRMQASLAWELGQQEMLIDLVAVLLLGLGCMSRGLSQGEVGRFPNGSSPAGVEDLVGLVWQWTDEYQDEHNRAAILRGIMVAVVQLLRDRIFTSSKA